MDRTYLRATRDAETAQIAEALQLRQFVHPHQAVSQAVADAGLQVRFCPAAAERAVRWLELDTDVAIGRLRRSELLQLARSIQRFWRQTAIRGERAAH